MVWCVAWQRHPESPNCLGTAQAADAGQHMHLDRQSFVAEVRCRKHGACTASAGHLGSLAALGYDPEPPADCSDTAWAGALAVPASVCALVTAARVLEVTDQNLMTMVTHSPADTGPAPCCSDSSWLLAAQLVQH